MRDIRRVDEILEDYVTEHLFETRTLAFASRARRNNEDDKLFSFMAR